MLFLYKLAAAYCCNIIGRSVKVGFIRKGRGEIKPRQQGRVKRKVYKMVVRPTFLYGLETADTAEKTGGGA